MVQSQFMMWRKVTILEINCMLFQTVLMSSLMVYKLWKMENILYVHPVKIVLLYIKDKISTIIVTEFKVFQVLLIVFLKLIKILFFQDLKMVLSEVLDSSQTKLFKLLDNIKKMITSPFNLYHFLTVEILSPQQVTTTQSNFMISVNLWKEDKMTKLNLNKKNNKVNLWI